MTDKIEPYSKEYYRRVMELAQSYMSIHTCKDCNSPVNAPYCCTFCGSRNP